MNVKYKFSGYMPRQEKDKGELVVYLHRRATTGEPFYVGMGTVDRTSAVSKRNDHWKRIYKKHGRTIELLVMNGSENFVKKMEIWLIAIYRGIVGRKRMANISDGGEGSYGMTGEKSGRFQGYLRLYNTDLKVQLIIGGEKNLKDNGFDRKGIYAVKNSEYQTVGSKFYADISGFRIRFQVAGPFTTREEAVIKGFSIAERNSEDAEPNFSGFNIGKGLGVLHGKFKGFKFGVNHETKNIVLSVGNKDTIAQGFHNSAVGRSIHGERLHHRGFIFTRISNPEEVIQLAYDYLEKGYGFHHELTEQNFLSLM